MKAQEGFTVAETFVAVTAAIAVAFLVYGQWQYAGASHRDSDRKTAVNTMHYYLEEVYFKQYKSYPAFVDASVFNSVNEDFIKDPSGHAIGEPASDFHYHASGCTVNACQRYELRTSLEKEDDFVRTNQQ